jgi:hypothetical protein
MASDWIRSRYSPSLMHLGMVYWYESMRVFLAVSLVSSLVVMVGMLGKGVGR